jgi:hypothetical protein
LTATGTTCVVLASERCGTVRLKSVHNWAVSHITVVELELAQPW